MAKAKPDSYRKAHATKPGPDEIFFDTLTLGIIKTLESIPRVMDITIEKHQSCEKNQVTIWEQRHCVYLPDDMKKFYLSMDGFKIQWSFQYGPHDTRRVGYIHIPQLTRIVLLRENISVSSNINELNSSNTSLRTKDIWGNILPIVSARTKIFEISNIIGLAKVCLIYESTGNFSPKICLLELSSLSWVFLADTFTEYLRMAVAHLGLPFWELCFSSIGLPPWTEQIFRIIAPHLIDDNEPRRGKKIHVEQEHPYNVIDPHIFRSKSSKGSRNPKNHKR